MITGAAQMVCFPLGILGLELWKLLDGNWIFNGLVSCVLGWCYHCRLCYWWSNASN
jgi:hypothetical protein